MLNIHVKTTPDIDLLQRQINNSYPKVRISYAKNIVYVTGENPTEEQNIIEIIKSHSVECGTRSKAAQLEEYKTKELERLEREINASPCAKAFFEGEQIIDPQALDLFVRYLIMKSDFLPNWKFNARKD